MELLGSAESPQIVCDACAGLAQCLSLHAQQLGTAEPRAYIYTEDICLPKLAQQLTTPVALAIPPGTPSLGFLT